MAMLTFRSISAWKCKWRQAKPILHSDLPIALRHPKGKGEGYNRSQGILVQDTLIMFGVAMLRLAKPRQDGGVFEFGRLRACRYANACF